MLPFLKTRKDTGIVVKTREPDSDAAPEMSNSEDPGLLAAASDLMNAVHARDEKGVAMALKAAFEMLQSIPEETPSEEPQS